MTYAPEPVDPPSTRELTRLFAIYALRCSNDLECFDALQLPGDVLDLGRFDDHFRHGSQAAPAMFPRLIAVSDRRQVSVACGEEQLPITSARSYGFHAPYTGIVGILELDADCALREAIYLLQKSCFERTGLTIDGEPFLEALSSNAVPAARGEFCALQFDRDVHQVVLPGTRLLNEISEPGESDTLFDRELLMRLIYREDAPFRSEFGSLRDPSELNRPLRSACVHARGVTVLAGAAEHVEHGVLMVASELVGAGSRLRTIRADAGVALSRADEVAFRGRMSPEGIGEVRAALARLSRKLGDLELQLSFGVEAYLDALRVPEVVLENYRESLSASLGLSQGVQTTTGILERVKTVLGSRRAELEAVEQRVAEIRRRSRDYATAYVTLIAIPLGLTFAFLSGRTHQVSEKRSLFDLAHYGWYYGGLFGVLLVSVVVYAGVRVRSSKRIPAVLSEVAVDR